MAQITIKDIEELLDRRDKDLVQRIKDEVSTEVSSRSVEVLFKCIGLDDVDNGKDILKNIILSAQKSAELKKMFWEEGKKSLIKFAVKAVGYVILGTLALWAIKLGIVKAP